MFKFLVIIEKAGKNYSAYSPDLPGCVATGRTQSSTEKNMYNAIKLHVKGLLEDHRPIPRTRAISEYMVLQ